MTSKWQPLPHHRKLIMTFEERLAKLIEDARAAGASQSEIETAITELHHRHGLEVPIDVEDMARSGKT